MAENSYHHKDLREKLVQKGLELLNEVGVEGFSLRKVASLCRVSHNAPYRHFKDKDELVQAIMAKAVHDFSEALTAAVQCHLDNPSEQLKELGKCYIEFFMENPEYLNLFFASDLKGAVYVRDGTFSYDEAFLFGVLVRCLNQYYRSVGETQEADPVLAIEFWSTIHGLTTLLVGKKLIFQGDWRKTIDVVLNRLVGNISIS